LDSDIRDKIIAARPSFDVPRWAIFGFLSGRVAKRFALDNIPRNSIHERVGEVIHMNQLNGNIERGPGINIVSFHPYKDCESLAFGTSIEHLRLEKDIQGMFGVMRLHAHIGSAQGDQVSVRSVFALTRFLVKPQTTPQEVEKCKKKFFGGRKCNKEIIQVPRGLSHDEMELLTQGAVAYTIDEAGSVFYGLNSIPENTNTTLSQEHNYDFSKSKFEKIQHTRILRGVARDDLSPALTVMIGALSRKNNEILSDSNSLLQHSRFIESNGESNHIIEIYPKESGVFDIQINSF